MSAIPIMRPSLDSSLDPLETRVMEREFERAYPALYRFVAVRVGNDQHLADDILQQLWLAARQNGPRGISARDAETWLRSVARKLIATHWRRAATRPAHVPLPDPQIAADVASCLETETLPDAYLARAEVRDQLLLAITELRAADQELIVGHYFEQRSQETLARERGTTVRAIEGRLYRARNELRQTLRTLVD